MMTQTEPAGTTSAGLRLGERRSVIRELAVVFLRLGLTAFGGPAAHVAMMEDEVVVRRRWLTRERFLDLLGATNLIPGPNSTEMAIHVGLERGGVAGLLTAGVCFILPAAVIVGVIAWAYVQWGSLPEAAGILYGIKPVVVAIVGQALWRLGRSALKNEWLAGLGVAAVALGLAGVHELLILFGAGVIAVVVEVFKLRRSPGGMAALGIGAGPMWAACPGLISGALPGAGVIPGVWPVFLFFLKVGSVLFGSGYVLLAFLRADLVERWGWLTEAQLLDAVAVGQFTPGPVFTTATFIGYLLGGVKGAVAATVGIFLPAFVLVWLSGPWIPRMRRSKTMGALLDGVNVGSLALMAVVTVRLGQAAIIDPWTVVLAIGSGVALLGFGVNSTWLILGGGLAGWMGSWVGGVG
ncbi:MAG: chromate efflux transporter [Phycisphaeraceae bacterium]|nr:chromate efflux transporter [Phycisphaeraceae bacterium]